MDEYTEAQHNYVQLHEHHSQGEKQGPADPGLQSLPPKARQGWT